MVEVQGRRARSDGKALLTTSNIEIVRLRIGGGQQFFSAELNATILYQCYRASRNPRRGFAPSSDDLCSD